MADEQKKKTRVACKYHGGMLIYKRAFGYDDGTGSGAKMLGGHDGPVMKLNGPLLDRFAIATNDPFAENAPFGITEIDADWKFEVWLEQNQKNPMVERGLVYVLKDSDPEHPEFARLEVPNVPA